MSDVIQLPTESTNEYGVRVMSMECRECKRQFTVTPYPDKLADWLICMGKDCGSYDPSRDCEWMFEEKTND